jgi:hypothetical protein
MKILLVLATSSLAALPEGPGLSANYAHDEGIEKSPAVLLVENF